MSHVTGPITLAAEGDMDIAVARRLIDEAGLVPGPEYVKRGKTNLDPYLAGYCSAAEYSCWLVLRDLDDDAACAPSLCVALLPPARHRLRLHVVVHALEAWLLADAEAIATRFRVPASRIPREPELLPRPKRTFIELMRASRSRRVVADMVPTRGSTAAVGPGYGALLIEFVTLHWRPDVAAARAPSLHRLRKFLCRIAAGESSCD